jgi:hypothetical protein
MTATCCQYKTSSFYKAVIYGAFVDIKQNCLEATAVYIYSIKRALPHDEIILFRKLISA